MQRIAKALNVSQSTITEDLRNLSTADKSKHAKTASNPKGSGRPKGSAKRQRRTTQQTEDTAAALVLDQGMTLEQAAAQTGLTSVQQVKTSVAREEGRREAKAGPDIDRVLLSMTAQEKLDAAIRQAKKRLELEFSESVRREVMRDLNEVTLPHYLDKIVKLERLIYARRGVLDKITYNKIRWCLHSDHVQDPAMKRRYDEAFTIFNGLEKLLLDEKHSPTPFRKDLPKTYADLMAARNKVREERRAGAAARRAGKTRVAERF